MNRLEYLEDKVFNIPWWEKASGRKTLSKSEIGEMDKLQFPEILEFANSAEWNWYLWKARKEQTIWGELNPHLRKIYLKERLDLTKREVRKSIKKPVKPLPQF